METTINPKDIPVPQEIRDKWQNIVNILTKVMHIPVGLIMRVDGTSFKVLQSSNSEGNPFKIDQEFTLPAGIYCEKTMKTQQKNLIPNALKDPEWDKNPSIAAGLISYLGFPIFYPDKNIFGTLCVLDKKENSFSADFEEVMSQFKEIIESHLTLIWQKKLLENTLAQQKATEEELKNKIKEIEEFNRVFVNRELKMTELKEKITKLEEAVRQTGADIK
jgi:GAF domain-containing protein